jgi:hypothetical protein
VWLLAVAGWACGQSVAEPFEAADVYVEVRGSGGIAGVRFAYALDGAAGAVVELRCDRACDPASGRVLTHVSPGQVAEVAELMRRARILDLDGTDFGRECCDQIDLVVTFRYGDREATVEGAWNRLPEPMQEAAARIVEMAEGVVPVLVAFETRPADRPGDPVTIERDSLVGSVLTLEVSYAGGCEDHVFDLVAWGGWLESFPVQVNVFLSHDYRGDACRALVTRELRFDLGPLAEAYRRDYGGGAPGATTIVLRLVGPADQKPVLIEYTF